MVSPRFSATPYARSHPFGYRSFAFRKLTYAPHSIVPFNSWLVLWVYRSKAFVRRGLYTQKSQQEKMKALQKSRQATRKAWSKANTFTPCFLFVVILLTAKLALEARLSFSRKHSFLQGYEFLPYILHRYSHRRHNAVFLLPPCPS